MTGLEERVIIILNVRTAYTIQVKTIGVHAAFV